MTPNLAPPQPHAHSQTPPQLPYPPPLFSKPCGERRPLSPCPLTSLALSLRVLHKLCKSLGLNLTKFTQYDENTWTEVGAIKLRNYVVETMPEKLGYKLCPREKGRAPEEIYQMALNKVGTWPVLKRCPPATPSSTLLCPVPPRPVSGPSPSLLPGLVFLPSRMPSGLLLLTLPSLVSL